MSSFSIITFYLTIKTLNFKCKFVLLDILLYAYPDMPFQYDKLMSYAYKKKFIRGSNDDNFEKAILSCNRGAIEFWKPKVTANNCFLVAAAVSNNAELFEELILTQKYNLDNIDISEYHSIFMPALKHGGELLKYALKIAKHKVMNTMNIYKLYDHIKLIVDEYPCQLFLITDDIVRVKNKNGFEKLMEFCDFKELFGHALRYKSKALINMLINKGCDINAYGSMPFWRNLMQGSFKFAEFLLNRGIKLEQTTINLLAFNTNNTYEIIRFCRENNVPVNIENNNPEKAKKILDMFYEYDNFRDFQYFVKILDYDTKNFTSDYVEFNNRWI